MMKKIFKLLAIAGLFLLPLSVSQKADADTIITDNAALLSSEEINQLEDTCDAVLNRYQTSVYIITSSDIGEKNDYEYYIKAIGEGKNAPKNLIILFISTQKKEPLYKIYGYGSAEKMLTPKRCKTITRRMRHDIESGSYYEAIDSFCDDALTYMGRNPMLDSFVFSSTVQLIFCLLLTCGILYLMLRSINPKPAASKPRDSKTKNLQKIITRLYAIVHPDTVAHPEPYTDAATYLDTENSQLLGRLDHFSHTTQTVIAKKEASSRKAEENQKQN